MGYIFNVSCKSKARLDGKTAVITGCNTGIGKETVRDFVNRGCRVIMACRDVAKAEAAAEEIRKATAGVEGVGVIVVVRLDLSSFASVRECAEKILQTETQINILVNNAGVLWCPYSLSADGYELTFAINHLGHFLFTLLLLPKILKSGKARIITVASFTHHGGNINFDDINCERSYYNASLAYTRSKLANILFAKELANRLKDTNVTSNSVHPGWVRTEITRNFDNAYCPGCLFLFKNTSAHFIKTPKQGAQCSIFCAVDESLEGVTGNYYSNCKKKVPSAKGRDQKLALQLWEESLKMVGLINYDPFVAEDDAFSRL